MIPNAIPNHNDIDNNHNNNNFIFIDNTNIIQLVGRGAAYHRHTIHHTIATPSAAHQLMQCTAAALRLCLNADVAIAEGDVAGEWD